jgi:SAM-dependent methyltransferase
VVAAWRRALEGGVVSVSPDPAEVRRAWESNAGFWDDFVGADGNQFHRLLVAPAQMDLLALRPGERVLELACGNGQFARQMATVGVDVVACDFSPTFVDRARAHADRAGLRIDHRVADVTDAEQLRALGAVSSFDAAVCTMAIHDIADIGPLAVSVRTLLKPHGRFVVSVVHPCFNGVNPTMVAETTDDHGDLVTRYLLRIERYLAIEPELGLGIVGQPQPHWYFPRTITELLSSFFDAGWVLDGIREPAFPGDLATAGSPVSWKTLPSIPPVLVARLRPIPVDGPPTSS